jgi:hypothetical protein
MITFPSIQIPSRHATLSRLCRILTKTPLKAAAEPEPVEAKAPAAVDAAAE